MSSGTIRIMHRSAVGYPNINTVLRDLTTHRKTQFPRHLCVGIERFREGDGATTSYVPSFMPSKPRRTTIVAVAVVGNVDICIDRHATGRPT